MLHSSPIGIQIKQSEIGWTCNTVNRDETCEVLVGRCVCVCVCVCVYEGDQPRGLVVRAPDY